MKGAALKVLNVIKIKLTLETREVGKDALGVVICCRLAAKKYSAL